MTAAAFRAAVESGDPDAAAAQFTPDAVFRSPTLGIPSLEQTGLRQVLGALTTVLEDFRYTVVGAGPEGHHLQFTCRLGPHEVQGVQVLRGTGPFTELIMMPVRPHSAARELRARMAELLAPGTAG
jgi:SnoaL-like domain